VPTSDFTLSLFHRRPEFRQQTTIDVSDYVKLQEYHKRRYFPRRLLAMAANHDTSEVFNPSYQPAPAVVRV
jgi:hypothetical protein